MSVHFPVPAGFRPPWRSGIIGRMRLFPALLSTRRVSCRLGRFEGRRGPMLCGWAFDASAPGVRQRVVLSGTSGTKLCLTADRFRADVLLAGHGDGHYGFSVPAARLGDPAMVQCRWADNGVLLEGNPLPTDEAARPLALVRRGRWRLRVDGVPPGDNRLSGYAVDLARPGMRLRLGLSGPDGELDRARACLYRADCEGPGNDGFHGFVLHARGPVMTGLHVFDLDTGTRLAAIRSIAT